MNNFDIGIIGAGVAGTFASLRLTQQHPNIKTVVFDLGRKWAKRRRQLEGWLGCLPNSDGKIYFDDASKISNLVGARKTKSAINWFDKVISNVNDFKPIKNKSPSISIIKKLKKIGYNVSFDDYIQMYPKDIHALSKYIANIVEQNRNITFCFDNEVIKIYKQRSMFVVATETQEYKCKKIILAVGRSGWRWAKALYSDFGIIESNDIAKFGIRIEMNSGILKDFNKSACSIMKEDIEIGPLCWFGTVIPEDHLDLAISSFRSNENRWKTDKVSFSLIGNRYFENSGFEQTDRLSKLTFVIANDRIIKERVSNILSGKSKISIMPEYDWLKEIITELSLVIPEIVNKAYFHVPTIIPLVPSINIGNNLSTEINGLYVAGESDGIVGILSAAASGTIAADMVCK
jgi:uncharacterized protein